MKNILYIGHYKDNSGLGESSRRYIDFLSSNIKYNLSIRPLLLTTSAITTAIDSNQYDEYENNSSKNYDTLIQHTFPDNIEYNKEFGKNIAIVDIETFNIKHSGWIDKLNLMDEVWVGSRFSAQSLLSGGLIRPIRIIPEPYNLAEYESDLRDNFFTYQKESRPFIFYIIGQYAEKSNIKSIVLAYLLEFNKKDNVKLFIKTCDHRKQNEDLENIIKYDISIIKNILRKPYDDYSDIDMLCGYLSKANIIRLHKSADCYINAVRADGFGCSAIEAALCGKIVVNTKNIGSSTYFNNTNSIMVNSAEVACMCSNSRIKNLYTIHERWFEPSIDDLRKAFRTAYNLSQDKKEELNNNFFKETFSYTNIQNLLS